MIRSTTRSFSPLDLHLPAARGDPDLAAANRLAVHALADGQRRAVVQIVGQRLGEDRRHVLHDEQRHRQIGRQLRHHLGQGLGTSGGNAQGDDLRRAGGRGGSGENMKAGTLRIGTFSIPAFQLLTVFSASHPPAVEDLLEVAVAGIGCDFAAHSRRNCSALASMLGPLGLRTKSKAPFASAATVATAPWAVKALSTIAPAGEFRRFTE